MRPGAKWRWISVTSSASEDGAGIHPKSVDVTAGISMPPTSIVSVLMGERLARPPNVDQPRPELQNGLFHVPVITVGVGPAMAISADIEFGDIYGNRSEVPYVSASTDRTAIGAANRPTSPSRTCPDRAPLDSRSTFSSAT
jgi:hypothetical protein